jgi:hypothetical protein
MPGKAGFSGSAAGSGSRDTSKKQKKREVLFIRMSLLLDPLGRSLSKPKAGPIN